MKQIIEKVFTNSVILSGAKNLRLAPSLALPHWRGNSAIFPLPLGEGRILNELASCKNSGEGAFTLAEVLITLGIIGIVAALTLPTLIAKYQKEILRNQFKKSYSELVQINQKFINDYDMNMCEYNLSLLESMDYVSASKELAKVFNNYFSSKSGTYKTENYRYATVNGKNNRANVSLTDDGRAVDGQKRTYYFEYAAGYINNKPKCPIITTDINGSFHGPNRIGVDTFSFRPTLNGKIIPIGNPDLTNDSANGTSQLTGNSGYGIELTLCSTTNTTENNGFGCAYWASIDKHPEDNTKTYWKDFLK